MATMYYVYLFCILFSVGLCFWYFLVDVRRSIVQNVMILVMLISNIGYFAVAASRNLAESVVSTKIMYVGACFLPALFFFSICEVCRLRIKSLIKALLIGIQGVLYLCVCSIGYYDIYYKNIGFSLIDGVGFLTKEYGYTHILYPISLCAYLLASFVVAFYTLRFRKNADRRSIIILVSVLGLTSASYLFRATIMPTIDFTPVIYIIMMTSAVVEIYRTDIFDVVENEAVIKEQLANVGFLTFDAQMRYRGANQFALNIFPELHDMPIGHIITNPPTAVETVFNMVQLFLDSRKTINDVCHVEGDNFKIEDRTYSTVIHSLQNFSNRCVGAMLEIRDITEHVHMMELTASYNDKLEREVAEKTSQIRSIQERTILGMAQMVESRDLSTGGHIKRTSAVVRIFAKRLLEADMGFTEQFLHLVVRSAPMHDLGKIGVDDAVLRKQGKFTDEEYEKMKKHSEIGGKMVMDVLGGVEEPDFVKVAFNVANFHHEKVNGKGYPMGLVGEMIPIEARIMALADVFDALVSKRCYKDAFTYDKAFSIITEDSGTHFDPKLVPIFVSCREELEEYYNNNDH